MATVVATVILFVGSMLYTRARPFAGPPTCPTCAPPCILLPQPEEGDRRLYDVWVCLSCSHTTIDILGSIARYAGCPSCRQRTLDVRAHRLPATNERPIAVELYEECQVCGFQRTHQIPDEGVWIARDNVLPFRRPR